MAVAALGGLVLCADARAANPSSLSLDPLCVTRAGSVLFFLEQTDNCDGVDRQCRRSRWAYAALEVGANRWGFESMGDASLDEGAAPESNVLVSRQLFKAPAAHPCASFFRAPRLPAPDLPYAEAWFEYSIEGNALLLHWQGQQVVVAPDARMWRLAWCGKGCKADEPPKAEVRKLKTEAAKGEKAQVQMSATVPQIDVVLGEDALLGFAETKKDLGREAALGYLVLRIPQAKLRGLQAKLLHQDAKRLLEKAAGDLFATARAAGLFDAALQLEPQNTEARLDYARLLAQQGEPVPVLRELEQLRKLPGLRARLEADPALESVRGKEAFKKFLAGLPK